MFGNRLGWGISAVLVMLMGVVVFYVGKLNAVSPPSQGMISVSQKVSLNLMTNPALLEPIVLPAQATMVLPTMTESGDAGPFYQRAIEAYDADKWAYEPDSRTGLLKSEDLAKLPGVSALMEATNLATGKLFAADPGSIINYTMQPEPIEKLLKVGKACQLLGLSKQADRNKAVKENRGAEADRLLGESVRFYEAAFSLGHKLVTERVRYAELDAGWQLMVGSAIGIHRVDPSRGNAKEFADACAKYHTERIKPLWVAIGAIDPGIVGRTAGDVFYVAEHSKERMWRVEAVLKLGRYRWDAGEGGRGADQRAAAIWAKRIANDPNEDPVVKVAAERARALTLEEYRMIH